VPSNVTIILEGQDLKVKGPLGELSRIYPREVKVERENSGTLKVSKAVDTRKANQMHGLFRYATILILLYLLSCCDYVYVVKCIPDLTW